MVGFSPMWDGLIQLRIYLGAANQPMREHEYAATDIRVTGNRWEVVRGQDVPCNSGKATSQETLLLPPEFLIPSPSAGPGSQGSPDPKAAPGQTTGPGGKQGTAGASSGGTAGASQPASPAAAGRPANESGSSGESGGPSAAVVGVGLLGLAGGGLFLARFRRRHAAGPPSSESPS
jgi:LPXTG-motif cell wall-anchored protein